jgi:hypothetical protein
MSLLVGLLILVLLAVPVVISLKRSTELFVLRIVEGKARLVRGRLPPRLFEDMSDVVSHPPVKTGQIRVVVERATPRLVLDKGELPAGQLQRLRNVLGRHRTQQIRAGKLRA